ncbi:MAG: hypothetical protein HYR67_14465 [Bacteroidetes bacterium]|nr:hypothetical protein [Bacteroidota bacterium]
MREPVFASLALAFASFGDAFLYPFLPVNNFQVGVPLVWVGVLLSINRFVRIFSNTWMVCLLASYGLRTITIIAVTLAILSTTGYAFANAIFVWLTLRIIWGLSFSALRISTLGYALQQQKLGLALGVSRGFQEAGPMTALLLAPVMLKYFDSSTIFILLAFLSIPALYFAYRLPKNDDRTPAVIARTFLKFPSTFNAITFSSALLIDGIVIVVLGILFLQYKENITLLTATTLAALYLGYRRVCLVLFSPAGGWMADKIGLDKVFSISLGLVLIGLFTLLSGGVAVGTVIVFTFYSIHSAITPGSVSNGHGHALQAVAENATWRDIGAAIGTLTGGLLITSAHLTSVLLILTFGLSLLLLVHIGTARKALKFLYSWK